MCRIIRLVLSSILLLGVVASVQAQVQNVERSEPPVMSAREAHAKALAGELVLVDIHSFRPVEQAIVLWKESTACCRIDSNELPCSGRHSGRYGPC